MCRAQRQRVERDGSMSARANMSSNRQSGRWSLNLPTATWANNPGPGRPRSIGLSPLYQGRGHGHAWPVLTGGRGHDELAAAHDVPPFIRAIPGP